MSLSSIGDEGVHNVEGVLCKCGDYNGSNPSLFGDTFCGPEYFITRADDFLSVRIVYYACGWFFKGAGDDGESERTTGSGGY